MFELLLSLLPYGRLDFMINKIFYFSLHFFLNKNIKYMPENACSFLRIRLMCLVRDSLLKSSILINNCVNPYITSPSIKIARKHRSSFYHWYERWSLDIGNLLNVSLVASYKIISSCRLKKHCNCFPAMLRFHTVTSEWTTQLLDVKLFI